MKYCISIRQPKQTLMQADEIKLKYKDFNILYDYIETYSNQVFIIEINAGDQVDWAELSALNDKSGNRFIISLGTLYYAKNCKDNNLQFFWKYPATTYYEAKGLADLGVIYLFITAPLTHDLRKVKQFDIPLRMVPNIAYDSYIPRETGITGQFVRPEDTDVYEQYIDTFEILAADLEIERTLFNIYKKKVWNGNLAFIIANLEVSVDNRGFPEDFASTRIDCRQRCQQPNNNCHFCETAVKWVQAAQKLASTRLEESRAQS